MLQFEPADAKWWGKPLVLFNGRHIPAELAVLSRELQAAESGAWLNSRGTKSGVVDLIPDDARGSYRTRRVSLPTFVSKTLDHLYQVAEVDAGCADLVIWNVQTRHVRLVEVKCPHWDRPSAEQEQFLRIAKSLGMAASIVEWEFAAAQSRVQRTPRKRRAVQRKRSA